jgi:hypothetical protein
VLRTHPGREPVLELAQARTESQTARAQSFEDHFFFARPEKGSCKRDHVEEGVAAPRATPAACARPARAREC